jgi:hypothetical protein
VLLMVAPIEFCKITFDIMNLHVPGATLGQSPGPNRVRRVYNSRELKLQAAGPSREHQTGCQLSQSRVLQTSDAETVA